MKTRGVKIVKKSGNWRKGDVDVFDLETGEKIEDIYEIDLGIRREVQTIRITSAAPWVYEGPAEFVTPEEAERSLGERVSRLEAMLDTLTDPDEIRAAFRGKEPT